MANSALEWPDSLSSEATHYMVNRHISRQWGEIGYFVENIESKDVIVHFQVKKKKAR